MKQNLIKATTTSVGQMKSLLPCRREGWGLNQHQTPAAPHDSPDITQRGSSVPQMHPLHPHGNVKAVLHQEVTGMKAVQFLRSVPLKWTFILKFSRFLYKTVLECVRKCNFAKL